LQMFRDVCEIAIKSQLERSAAQEQTPPLLQVENALSATSAFQIF
jgi:hypothetical protein